MLHIFVLCAEYSKSASSDQLAPSNVVTSPNWKKIFYPLWMVSHSKRWQVKSSSRCWWPCWPSSCWLPQVWGLFSVIKMRVFPKKRPYSSGGKSSGFRGYVSFLVLKLDTKMGYPQDLPRRSRPKGSHKVIFDRIFSRYLLSLNVEGNDFWTSCTFFFVLEIQTK